MNKDDKKQYTHGYSGAEGTSLDNSAPPPAYNPDLAVNASDDKEALFPSNSSSSSSLAPPELPNLPTTDLPIVIDPSRTLAINARGIKWLRLPTPNSQLETEISNAGTNSPVYVSTRPKRSSGDCTLRSAIDPNADIISTQYKFGAGREPQIKLYNPDRPIIPTTTDPEEEVDPALEHLGRGIEILKIKSKWVSRAVSMVNTGFGGQSQPQSNMGVVYEWRYVKAKEYLDESADVNISQEISEARDEDANDSKKKKKQKQKEKSKDEKQSKILTLTARDTTLGASILDPDNAIDRRTNREPEKVKVIAQLIRTRDTVAEGTKRRDAGNGGHLVFDVDADKYMAENLIVATCLMMLKKEVDRRRMCQFAMMAAMAGGGSGGG